MRPRDVAVHLISPLGGLCTLWSLAPHQPKLLYAKSVEVKSTHVHSTCRYQHAPPTPQSQLFTYSTQRWGKSAPNDPQKTLTCSMSKSIHLHNAYAPTPKVNMFFFSFFFTIIIKSFNLVTPFWETCTERAPNYPWTYMVKTYQYAYHIHSCMFLFLDTVSKI